MSMLIQLPRLLQKKESLLRLPHIPNQPPIMEENAADDMFYIRKSLETKEFQRKLKGIMLVSERIHQKPIRGLP